MKTLLKIPFFLLFLALALNSSAQTRGCGTMENLAFHQTSDSTITTKMENAEATAQQWLAQHAPPQGTTGIVSIPVVFHVVSEFQSQVPPLPRMLSQMDVLNEDFNAQNADFVKVPTVWASIAANVGIRFCLATQDPQGNPTSGITYTTTTVSAFSTNDHVKFDSLGGCDAWDPTRYLNVWICKLSSPILGYAQFPWSSRIQTDGIVLAYNVVGRHPNNLTPYDLGRTLTHEIGHYFGLIHTWGDDFGACSGTDRCVDTPNQGQNASGCPSFPLLDNCAIDSPGVMFMNYMDYTHDFCMYMFTQDQASRMLSYLHTARRGLLNSNGCITVGVKDPKSTEISIFPNPNSGRFTVGFNAFEVVELTVFDAHGRQIEFRKIDANGDTRLTFDLSAYTKGIYFIRLSVDGVISTKKLLMN